MTVYGILRSDVEQSSVDDYLRAIDNLEKHHEGVSELKVGAWVLDRVLRITALVPNITKLVVVSDSFTIATEECDVEWHSQISHDTAQAIAALPHLIDFQCHTAINADDLNAIMSAIGEHKASFDDSSS